jgi:uncharacterized protein YbjT (DUF2867 family)
VNVVLFGATGMVGEGVLIECLDDPRIESVLVVGRRSCGVTHAKLRELLRSDLFDFTHGAEELSDLDACFFCLGVSAAGMSEADYHRISYDLTVATAKTLLELNPALTFCHVTGQGTDSTEKGRMMWARVKGKVENQLLRMSSNAYMFRPGYIQPMRGVRHRSRLYRALHAAFVPFYKLLLPRLATTTVHIGQAMIEVAAGGHSKCILENSDINLMPTATHD